MRSLTAVDLRNDGDILRVMNWRNDRDTRQYFFHREMKVWPAYRGEFVGHYAGVPIGPKFVCEDDMPVGFLGFRIYPDIHGSGGRTVSVDIMMAAAARGRGAGSWALTQIPDLARSADVAAVVGEINPANTASIKIFEKGPFKRFDEMDKSVPDTGETHRIVRYVWKRDGSAHA